MQTVLDKLLSFLLNPQNIVFKIWKTFPVGSFKRRLDYDVFSRPHYAFCTYHAARLAQLLGVPKISVIEFGVAGGNGLVELEALAAQIEREFDTRIEVYGFDSGKGLPPPVDYRDLPYVWQEGFFEMDVQALKSRLSRSHLVLGDVKDTVPLFIERYAPPPIGALFMDLDYYSSTRDALEILVSDPEWLLPRIYCYFDDVISNELGGVFCDRVGQLRAIQEYNDLSDGRCLAKIAGFGQGRRRPTTWNNQIYVNHTLHHPSYNTYIHADENRQLRLE